VPLVDGLEWNTLLHTPYWGSNNIGIFEWGLLYKEMPLPDEKLQKKKHQTEPNQLGVFFVSHLLFALDWQFIFLEKARQHTQAVCWLLLKVGLKSLAIMTMELKYGVGNSTSYHSKYVDFFCNKTK
jgi:hypothetical protein